ncbi:MAG: hypothetical protein IJN53_03570 [Oscillospiraceae bacterium]|nr:hypothetical protein [Oscillospiraceae bacterium]
MAKKNGIARHFGAFFGLLAALYALLVLSALIPNKALEKNMSRSGLRYFQQEAYPNRDGRFQRIADNRADQLLVNIAWNMGQGNPLSSTIDTQYYDGGGFGLNTGLYQAVLQGRSPNTPYPQYWHGSAALVRFAHLFTDAQGMAAMGLWVLCALLLANVALLIRKGHWELALCLMISMLSVQFGNLGLSITYQPCFVLCLCFCPAFVLLERRGDSALTLLCVLSGAATAFFDFLTTETLPLLLPLILVVAIRAKDGGLTAFPWRLLLSCGLCWGAAYIGAFVCKWALASLLTGQNQFLTGFIAAGKRMDAAPQSGFPPVIAGILANLSVFFGSTERIDLPRVLLGLGSGAAGLGLGYAFLRKAQPCRWGALAALSLGAVVLLRFALLGNHSYLHEFFTYRALCATVMAVLTAFVLNIRLPQKEVGQ